MELEQCAVCGAFYSPAETYKMERDYFASWIRCSGCGTRHWLTDLSPDECEVLENHNDYRGALREAHWLERVAALYQRHPECVPQGKLPAMRSPGEPDPVENAAIEPGSAFAAEDREVLRYLRRSFFSLPGRMTFVQERIGHLKPLVEATYVSCPTCGSRLDDATHNGLASE